MFRFVALCLRACAVTAAALAQLTTACAAPPTVSVPTQIELPRLLDLAAERLRLTVEYDAGAIKGAVTLRLAEGLSDAELWDVTNRLLAARGFTTVRLPADRAYSVVKITEAAGQASVQPEVSAEPAPG